MFIDEAEIHVKAGDGGHGSVSFRREAGIPRGGPDGGDGGNGGSIIFHARPGVDTLLDFKGRHDWRAIDGEPGHGKNMTGASGDDLVIAVPPGTLVYDKRTGVLLKDLDTPDMRVTICRGGKGGRGNARFATSTNQTPRIAGPGLPGEERWLHLELKLIADVGLVGLPNAGKSTLLSRLSAAHPKIADYPFTTLDPGLGIVEAGQRRFVMADLPGLIEGAHEGVGLGDEFLRHVERTRVLVHLVEVTPHTGQAAADAYRTIRKELKAYSKELAAKQEIVVLTKGDLAPDDTHAARDFSRKIKKPVFVISSATGKGLAPLVKAILDLLDAEAAHVAAGEAAPPLALAPEPMPAGPWSKKKETPAPPPPPAPKRRTRKRPPKKKPEAEA
jgi:GTP-binding protein